MDGENYINGYHEDYKGFHIELKNSIIYPGTGYTRYELYAYFNQERYVKVKNHNRTVIGYNIPDYLHERQHCLFEVSYAGFDFQKVLGFIKNKIDEIGELERRIIID